MSDKTTDNLHIRTSSEERRGDTGRRETHPICQLATDPEACEKFVERLEEASANIERRS